MFQLDYGDHRPIYEQIKEKFAELIISGALRENDKIPSVRELAGTLAINPNTIQKAYRDLESDGYIYSVRAKGCFVAPRQQVVKRSDTAEILTEYRTLVDKLKFLGVPQEELVKILGEEYEERCEN
ncbi:MAG: GntR family transcriptional regulator [Clostridia bacterium]|nr:GntR family transcriptional regulator [Clostridia bacterium]